MPHPFSSVLVTTSVGLFGHSAKRILKVIGTTGHRQWQQASLITYGLWKNGSAILSRLVSQIQTPPEIAHDIGVDGILLWGINRYSDEEMSRYIVRRQDWIFDYKEQGLWENTALYEGELLRARRLADEYGLQWIDRDTEEVGFFRVMDKQRRKSESAPQAGRRGIKGCRYPWEWLMINIDGNVRPCCHAKKFIGNLSEMPSEEIWNGAAMKEVRRKILAGEIPELCQGADCKFVNNEKQNQLSLEDSI